MDISEIRKKAKALEESKNADINGSKVNISTGESLSQSGDVIHHGGVTSSESSTDVVDVANLEYDIGEELETDILAESIHSDDEEHNVDDLISGNNEPNDLDDESVTVSRNGGAGKELEDITSKSTAVVHIDELTGKDDSTNVESDIIHEKITDDEVLLTEPSVEEEALVNEKTNLEVSDNSGLFTESPFDTTSDDDVFDELSLTEEVSSDKHDVSAESLPVQKEVYMENQGHESKASEDILGEPEEELPLGSSDEVFQENKDNEFIDKPPTGGVQDDTIEYGAVDKRGLLGLDMLQADDDLALEQSKEVIEELEAMMFDLGDETYGINIENVEEVVNVQVLTEVPRAPSGILGIITLRGSVIPIIDVKAKLNLGSSSDGERIVIVEVNGTKFGFYADKVLNVVRINKKDIEEPPIINTVNGDLLAGIGRHRGKRFILLDLSSLVMEEA